MNRWRSDNPPGLDELHGQVTNSKLAIREVCFKGLSQWLQIKIRADRQWRAKMTATLKLTHKAFGVEVRRGTYDIVVDGQRAGSLEMNDTIEIPVEPGRHTLQIRSGRNSSRTQTFEAAESQTVAFRCTGKSFLPIFLASFVVPSLALQLRREADDRSL